ncbi:hypothetical protein ACQPZP_17955 [Spirillospora sp. CA-142024]|uniref:hypothetical protein n=1 Tax=Spirillospora sp. CA-142024 TaxID=3240036 RepID=UPI003D94741B
MDAVEVAWASAITGVDVAEAVDLHAYRVAEVREPPGGGELRPVALVDGWCGPLLSFGLTDNQSIAANEPRED